MEISSKYDPSLIEDKWYQYWMEKGFFHSAPDERESYCIVIPPPNVTGVLHMGHMLNNTIQDVLIRRARMQGKNACWVPGTDHASIATEAKVVKMLAEKGIAKKDLSREEFLEYAWEWTHKYGGIILEQLKKLGASCDWNRTRFTMEPSLYDAVIDVFIDLYKKGLIYRGTKMVNWDPQGRTTLSDEEVIFKEVNDNLYYVKYVSADNTEEFISVATARPETIAGDVAVCVHPEDERYKAWIGKQVIVPLINRKVPVIADDYIAIDFGTGVLKVTPAHDINDYKIGEKYKLPVYDTLNEDGTISEAGILFVGKDRFEARKLWIKELEHNGLLLKTEAYRHNVGFSERTDAVVEPRISTQWFMNMQAFMKKNPAVLSSVMNDEISFHPPKFKNTYNHWISNIKDWNISRQLWWGHRIPAWYSADGNFVVAKDADNAATEFAKRKIVIAPESLKQDEDVLDTWFSSWLWPISVFDGFTESGKKELDYYYPTNDLVTAPEIIFFWVARMIMAGYEYGGEKPFKNVYFTGIVRDKQRRKMSKSLGNSPDPLDLIAKYGADGVRMGMLLCSPAGNDILFDESQVEQGRNFCNKIWNAYRLVSGWETEGNIAVRANEKQALQWFEAKADNTAGEMDKAFEEFRLNDALMAVYKLIWDDFCSVLLETIKPPHGEKLNPEILHGVMQHFDKVLKLLHPFMPFITEELHHALHGLNPDKPCIIDTYPKSVGLERPSELPLILVAEIRNMRNSKGISPKEKLEVVLLSNDQIFTQNQALIEKMANITLEINGDKPEAAVSVMAGTSQAFIKLNIEINTEAEKKRLQEEIAYLEGFMRSVDAKLSNDKFVANAKPDVVERERQKKADAEQKIESLQSQLQSL
ncbi:MAG: valine--tRNA ligase [Sphingomonadales bacterium]|nr:valine--tRNA ligase [Sphingomonadales bacterium]